MKHNKSLERPLINQALQNIYKVKVPNFRTLWSIATHEWMNEWLNEGVLLLYVAIITKVLLSEFEDRRWLACHMLTLGRRRRSLTHRHLCGVQVKLLLQRPLLPLKKIESYKTCRYLSNPCSSRLSQIIHGVALFLAELSDHAIMVMAVQEMPGYAFIVRRLNFDNM